MYHLPLFPLNVVLFPGMPLDLHIFERRYRKMIRTCLDEKAPFGVVLIRQGVEALGPLAVPYPVGCSARIVQVEHLEDGRMNLVVVGDERFRIHSLDTSLPYLRGEVESFPLENPHPLTVLRVINELRSQVSEYLRRLSAASKDELDLSGMELPDDVHGLLYLSAALLQIPLVEKQPLLEAPHAGDLLAHLHRLYRREIALLSPARPEDEERTRRSAWLN